MGLQDFNYIKLPQVTDNRILSTNWIFAGGLGVAGRGSPLPGVLPKSTAALQEQRCGCWAKPPSSAF